MKKLLLLLLINFNVQILFSQNDNFSYDLEYWKEMGIDVIKAEKMSNGNFILISFIKEYSPDTYPNLFETQQEEQDNLGKNFFISVITDSQYNVLKINRLYDLNQEEEQTDLTSNNICYNEIYGFIEGDGDYYFFGKNRISKLNNEGAMIYVKDINSQAVSCIDYFNNKLYLLTIYDSHQSELTGELKVLNSDNGVEENAYVVADTEAMLVKYTGLAVDETGIYILGGGIYMGAPSHNHTFYYTPKAWQAYMQQGSGGIFSFLSKHRLDNPSQRIWSTYIGGSGMMNFTMLGNGTHYNHLKIIDHKLYALAYFNSATLVTTPGTFSTDNQKGFALMEFDKGNSFLKMGTYLDKLGVNTDIAFASGQYDSNNIVLMVASGFFDPNQHQNTPEELFLSQVSDNAKFKDYKNNCTIITSFNSDGQRNWATFSADKYMALSCTLVEGTDAFNLFFHKKDGNNHITSTQPIVNISNQDKKFSSVAKYKYNPASNHLFAEELITLYPNPVENVLYLQGENILSIAEINVFDSLGNKIFTTQYHNGIEVSHLLPGVYYVGITMIDGSMRNLKFVKK